MSLKKILTSRHLAAVFFIAAAIFLLPGSALAHGPGGHGGSSFTALKALNKGVNFYDKLVASGKIEESWETGLKRVEIQMKGNETVVSFSRENGDPENLYIFFNKNGEYSGSNFTGK